MAGLSDSGVRALLPQCTSISAKVSLCAIHIHQQYRHLPFSVISKPRRHDKTRLGAAYNSALNGEYSVLGTVG